MLVRHSVDGLQPLAERRKGPACATSPPPLNGANLPLGVTWGRARLPSPLLVVAPSAPERTPTLIPRVAVLKTSELPCNVVLLIAPDSSAGAV